MLFACDLLLCQNITYKCHVAVLTFKKIPKRCLEWFIKSEQAAQRTAEKHKIKLPDCLLKTVQTDKHILASENEEKKPKYPRVSSMHWLII